MKNIVILFNVSVLMNVVFAACSGKNIKNDDLVIENKQFKLVLL